MNPIEKAVAPLKEIAVQRSVERMERKIKKSLGELKAVEGDAKIAAPFPNSSQSRASYVEQKGYYDFVRSITEADKSKVRHIRMSDPEYRVANKDRIEKKLQDARDYAAAQYEAYVAKLNSKIGEAVEAKLIGSSVWGHSILIVTKADGSVENWKTQIIVNVSSLGKLFNQWPTRKIK